MEQSYPKSGHESHIGRLLQQCLATFEKDVKYHQDRRYIRLWINYVSNILFKYVNYVIIYKANKAWFLDKYAKDSFGVVSAVA